MMSKKMRMKLFVAALILAVYSSIVLARGIACENYCSINYSDHIAVCNKIFGPGGEQSNPDRLKECKDTAWKNYENCMTNCTNEQ